MKELTDYKARASLLLPEQTSAGATEIRVVRRGQPVACILPVTPQRWFSTRQDSLDVHALQTVPSVALLAEAREETG